MKHYLLDTNIISYLIDPNCIYRDKINSYLSKLNNNDKLSVSIITLYELSYGFHSFNSNDKKEIEMFKKGINFLKSYFDIIPLDINEIDIFGRLKAEYKNTTGINTKSNKKNDLDFLICATAINHNATLVSNDDIFKKLSDIEKNLKCENWVK